MAVVSAAAWSRSIIVVLVTGDMPTPVLHLALAAKVKHITTFARLELQHLVLLLVGEADLAPEVRVVDVEWQTCGDDGQHGIALGEIAKKYPQEPR